MKIAINTHSNASSVKVCVTDLSRKFSLSGHQVVLNDWENYKDYDLILFLPHDSEVKKAKQENPNAVIGILSQKITKRKYREEAGRADFITADSIEVRDAYLPYAKNIFIYYMFPEIEERIKQHVRKDKIIIGYHGNKVHLNCAKDLKNALDKLGSKYNIEFWAMYNISKLGKWRINVPQKIPVKHIQWSEQNYYKYLSQSDIGVCPAKTPVNGILSRPLSSFFINPLRYNRWDYVIRFKYATNAGRVYPFSQMHIPVVAEFMPSFCQIIQDSYSGFLVCSEAGWYYAFENLINSPDLRNKMSKNLKTFIDNNCSPQINFENLLKFINKLKNDQLHKS
jgi:hypothetical protein